LDGTADSNVVDIWTSITMSWVNGTIYDPSTVTTGIQASATTGTMQELWEYFLLRSLLLVTALTF
jgi:hypothetical protein